MKAVILAGGFGTRFLPLTKAMPKEMLPLGDMPILEHIVKELSEAGIKDIMIVISKHKKMIKNYFTKNKRLEQFLIENGKQNMLDKVTYQSQYGNICFAYQKKMLGMQDAVMCAKKFIGDDDFILCTGDDVFVNEDGASCAKQMIDLYNKLGKAIIVTDIVPDDMVHLYGIVKHSSKVENKVEYMVEKPKSNAPSNEAILGRYLLPSKVLEYAKDNTSMIGNEFNFLECLNVLAKCDGLYTMKMQGKRFDTGNKKGYAEAFRYFADKD